MKAVVLHGPNDLRVEDRPQPKPGPGQALVQVAACGVCKSDLDRVRTPDAARLPLIIGHEFAGRVVARGEGSQAEVGSRAAVYPLLACGACPSCRRRLYECCSNYSYHGSRTDGGFAEFVASRDGNLVPVPDDVGDAEAALTEPAAVALHALNRAGLRKGESLLVIGAGTMGILAAQIARARGARGVILLDIAEERLRFARTLGFDRAVLSAAPDLLRRVREIAGDGGPDIVLEAAGSPAACSLAIDLAAPDSRVVLMGNISGDLALPRERVSSILRKQLRILGTWNSSLVNPENEWAAVLAMVAAREISPAPLISHRIRLEELPATISMMQEMGEAYRKVVVEFQHA